MKFLVVLSIRGLGWNATQARVQADSAMRAIGALRADPLRDDLWEVEDKVTSQQVVHALEGILRGTDEARFYFPARRGVLEVHRQQGVVK